MIGIYRITNSKTGEFYIGSSKNIRRRFTEHRYRIRNFKKLDCNWDIGDYDLEDFVFDILEECSPDILLERENFWYNTLNCSLCKNNKSPLLQGYHKNINPMSGKRWYTNGIIEIASDEDLSLQTGWRKGRLSTSTSYIREVGPDTYHEGPREKPESDYVSCDGLDIQILSNNEYVPLRGILFNNKKASLPVLFIEYLQDNKKRTVKATIDHPFHVIRGRVRADELTLSDRFIDSVTGESYEIIGINTTEGKHDTYDVETDNDIFDLSGILSHNCRTANGKDINQTDPKLAQLKDGRGNISPVTIILPTLAMEVKEKVDAEFEEGKRTFVLRNLPDSIPYYSEEYIQEFMKLLDKKINEAKDMLIERFDWQCSQSAKSAKFMYENGLMYGYKPEEGIRSALKHGTIVIGQLGLAEALQILIGCDHTEERGMELAKRIEQLFKDKCAKFKQSYKLNFGVYYTPAENLCHTAMNKFKAKYGEISKVSDHDWFTNSMHIPVWHKIDAFRKIDLESQLTGYSSAGCITYVELDTSSLHNIDALEKLVNYAMDKDIPYFAINTCNDLCNDCGYQGEINDKCPKCGSENIQRLRRVTGYITGNYKTAFNLGKQHETENRVKHTGIEITENK